MGQQMMAVVESMEAVDDLTFTIKLEETWGLVLAALGKMSSNVPFMMRSASPRPTLRAGPGERRLRPLRLRQGRVGAGSQGDLRQEPGLRPPAGAGERRGGRQARALRPLRVALHPRRSEQDERAHQRRSGLLGESPRRSRARARGCGRCEGRAGRPLRHPGLDAHQPPASAVRQPDRPAGGPVRREPGEPISRRSSARPTSTGPVRRCSCATPPSRPTPVRSGS